MNDLERRNDRRRALSLLSLRCLNFLYIMLATLSFCGHPSSTQ